MRSFVCCVALVGLVYWIGCSKETGILISVTTHESFSGEIARLKVHVSTDVLPVAGDARYYVDNDPAAVAELGTRNLRDDPYMLHIRPKDNTDTSVMVIALAYEGAGDDSLVGFGRLAAPISFVDGKLHKWQVVLRPARPDEAGFVVGGEETVLTTRTGCVKWRALEEPWNHMGSPTDADCDDSFDVCADNDVDCLVDCDPTDPSRNPLRQESCDPANTIDYNCDDSLEPNQVWCECEAREDKDGDSYTPDGFHKAGGLCEPSRPDCNDLDEFVFPGAPELCDGVDNNCNGFCDDQEIYDPDGDRVTSCGSHLSGSGSSCLEDGALGTKDCKPEDPWVFPKTASTPGAKELCDKKDNDCDPTTTLSEGANCYGRFEEDGLHYCQKGVRDCSEEEALGDECTLENGGSVLGAVDDAYCQVYDSCDGNIADPYQCILELEEPLQPADIGGVYEVSSWTKNLDACSPGGEPVRFTHFALQVSDGAVGLSFSPCNSPDDCSANSRFELHEDTGGTWKGEGFEGVLSEQLCTGYWVDVRARVVGPGEVGVAMRRKPVQFFPVNVLCTTDDARKEAEGQACTSFELALGTQLVNSSP